MKEQKLPKWFTGTIYSEGSKVQNPFSGEYYELNNEELSMYDYIIGCNDMLERNLLPQPSKTLSQMRKGLNWFRKNNPEAYMVLLD